MGAKTVIKFYATWCGPCKAYDTTWNKVKEELNEKYKFMEINVDKDTSGLAAKYNIRSIPATIVLNNNDAEVTGNQTGVLSSEELKKLILN